MSSSAWSSNSTTGPRRSVACIDAAKPPPPLIASPAADYYDLLCHHEITTCLDRPSFSLSAMAEEPALPRLPTVAWDAETQSFANTRKRGRNSITAQSLHSNSSDPAVFSSDDDPHVDNYANGRHRKKRYVGSWYQQQPASSDSAFSDDRRSQPKAKRTLERQVDSGVWMGSDSSIDIEDESFAELLKPAQPKLPSLRRPLDRGKLPSANPSTEDAVRKKIQTAIDNGDEVIDLSSLGISTISNATISQLSLFSCIPVVTEDVPFEQRDPSLRLYLFSNPLLRAPGALFNLEYLTVLSLRNARLTELPPSIKNLRNLQTLNVSLNRLRCLPAELLELLKMPGQLSELSIHPNPFHHADELPPLPDIPGDGFSETRTFEFQQDMESSADSPTGSWRVRILARSPVQYNDSRGVVLSKFRLPSNEPGEINASTAESLIIPTEKLDETPTPSSSIRTRTSAGSTGRGRVLSLFELALQSCSRTAELPELTSYLSPSAPPRIAQSIDRLIQQGEDNANQGDVPCSTCGRRIITPLVEWVEWWYISKLSRSVRDQRLVFVPLSKDRVENAVPFLRRGCSRSCLPKTMEVGQLLPSCFHAEKEFEVRSGHD
ncbi:hypothetical protein F4780DRAFT_564540 [Xylariomycetidae sp. FL0641]|nr:hypothetical protein F4780DRAFT_564540 [Xylariomycetidae sp. FL0641]